MARGKGQYTLDKGKNSLHVEYCVSDLVHMFPFQQLVDDSYIDSVDDSYIDSISMSRAKDQTRLISTWCYWDILPNIHVYHTHNIKGQGQINMAITTTCILFSLKKVGVKLVTTKFYCVQTCNYVLNNKVNDGTY